MRNVCAILAVVVMLASGSTPNVLAVDFFDNFDNYTVGDDIVDQDPGRLPGGWAGWDGFFVAGAPISDAVSFSGANSVLISGDNGTDLVHEFAGITSGRWEISAMQYIPAASTGNTFFIMMSEYTMGGDPKTWAAQLEANMDTETLTSTIITGTSVPLVLDDWAEIKIDADLDQHTADVYYNGTLIGSGAWNGGIQAVDLYPTATATTIYYDDFTLAQYPELTWDDAQSGNWNSANWTGGPPSVPDDRTYALINAAGRTVTVAADAQTRALSVQGGTLSINTGRTLSVATTAEFAPDTLLNIAAGGQLSVGATPSGNPGAIDLTSGGRLSVPSTMAMPASLDLRGGTFEITGELALVDDALSHYGFHINDDALAMDLHWNGGMMGNNDPTSFSNFYAHVPLTNGPDGRGLDFNDDNDFINSGAIGQNDNYSNLWVGYLHVDAASAGDWEFRNAGDDDAAGIWLDVDRDGEFYSDNLGLLTDNGEQLSWEDGGAKARTLTEGDYLIAFTHREGGGGSRADFTFKSPSMGAEARVKPGDPAQAGLWSSYGELPGAFSKALDIAVHEDSGLVINAIGGATLGSLTLNNGGLSVDGDVTFSSTSAPAAATASGVGGDGTVAGGPLTIASNAFTLLAPGSGTVTYDSISIPGTATALTLDVNSTMTPGAITANGGSPVVTVTKMGVGTVRLNSPNVNMDNASWAVNDGTLEVDVTNADPLAGAPVTLGGGTLQISTTAYDPNSMVPNVVDHAFYDHATDLNAQLGAIDDGIDNNMNGGLLLMEPTTTQKWSGEIWQGGSYPGSDNYYSQIWSGTFTAPKTGTYTFNVSGDDYEMLWIDKNGDGEFDNTEENETVTSNIPPEGWNTAKTGTIDLTAGQSYDFALGHNEGTGGDNMNATITIPDGAPVRMNPSAPDQAGWWSSRGGTMAINVTSTITVDNPVAVGGPNNIEYAYYDNVDASQLAAIDDGEDNGLNGGLLSLTPTSRQGWTEAIWQGGNVSDTYHQVWSGKFTAPETGTYEFAIHGDDYEMFWIDKNHDGEFDGAEETVTANPHDDPDGWNTPRTGSITLTAGETYDFLLGHNEVGGGDFLNATIKIPSGTAVRMNPSNPAQDGWWSADIVYGDSTININTEAASTIDQIILKQGGLAITGAPVTVGQASISTDTIGIVGLITHTPTVLTGTAGLQGNDQTVVLTKTGAADLVLNKAGVGLGSATIAVNEGNLISQAAAGANPLGGAALALRGGTFVASATSAAISPVTYDNAISVAGKSTLTAAPSSDGHDGPMTVNLTGPVTLDAQLNLSADDNYELNVGGTITGPGGLLFDSGTVTLSAADSEVGTITASGGTVSTVGNDVAVTNSFRAGGTRISIDAGSFGVRGTDLASGADLLTVSGNTLTIGGGSPLSLQSLFTFDTKNGTTVPDMIGGPAHDGELIAGADISTGGMGFGGGEALQLTTEGDYMDIADPQGYNFSEAYTWTARIKTTAGSGAVFSRNPDGTAWNQGSQALFVRGNNAQFDAGWVGNPNTNTAVQDDAWHQLVVTFDPDGDAFKIFVDGVAKYDQAFNANAYDEATTNHNSGFANTSFTVGKADFSGGLADLGTLIGLIDDVAIFSEALVGDELAQLLNNGAASMLGGAVEMPMTHVNMTANSTLTSGSESVTLGNLTAQPAVTSLNFAGASYSFQDAAIAGGVIVTGEMEVRGALDIGNGVAGTVTVGGDSELAFGS
ncbi:MAG: hypothetical protein HQ567_17955, partial [Candidatus Nealsonbacteria bacterium]|nr:hypothetical protein [Candidatus Nealsonbacteria bacterium]